MLNLSRLSVRKKLLLPNVTYLFIIALLALLTVLFKQNSTRLNNNINRMQTLQQSLTEYSNMLKDFVHKEVTYDAIAKSYAKIEIGEVSEESQSKLKSTYLEAEKLKQLQDANKEIDTEITKLVNNSMSLSNTFIKETALRLADPIKKDEVTPMERMVLIGANINTTSNLTIQNLYGRMQSDITVKKELLDFIDTLTVNATRDVEALKNTPFAMLPVQALESNNKIKDLTLNTISNTENIGKIEKSILDDISGVINEESNALESSTKVAFQELEKVIYIFFTVISILILAGIALTLLISSDMKSAIIQIVNNSHQISIGNIALENVDHQGLERVLSRRDELGDIAKAFEGLTAYIQAKADIIHSFSEGDISKDTTIASEKDYFGKHISNMSNGLNSMISRAGDISEQVATSAENLSSASSSLSDGSQQQAAALQEISASIIDLTHKTERNSDHATKATSLAKTAQEASELGTTEISEMTSAISDISNSSNEISKINDTIESIAFQTNLLALNAAVEAARAGQSGKGFAVVADEVRSLAGRSAKAAKETTTLIQASSQKVQRGIEIVEKTAISFNKIHELIIEISELIGTISEESGEQNSDIHSIESRLEQIENVLQQNAAHSEQTASASEELSSQADYLQELLAAFKLKKDRENRATQAETKKAHPQSKTKSTPPKTPKKPVVPAPKPNAIVAQNHEEVHSDLTQEPIINDDDYGKY